MEDPVATFKRLLALTTSPNEDEARNAALSACKIILKFNLTLVMPAPNLGTTFPAPQRSKVRVRQQPPPPPPPVDDDWRKIKAKFDGYCKWCRKPIKKNAPIYWSKENGAYHPVCYLNSGET